MAFKHLFKAVLNWTSKKEVSSLKIYSKNHQVKIEGKPILEVSAAKAFKGDPELYNPEDLLLSSLVSCHMMSYLYICSQNGIEVLEYLDNAEATLEVNPDGSGRFVEVKLFPKVKISNSDQIELALNLHFKANQLCFIANSCNFPVLHEASCEVL
ncbi:OsmC family protein [Flavobacterium johnsoniae]|uniref:OsmC family protein n=1 Tax=Flavobacterium johnsoniae (strain ATCC 17061 / DSM 2064 / JCM 8514 / BCRC 14874 / CCUG 350202 / NBRC 14942 / NCIMB 11054 / UW101) TaxID=376686 RepID=A5FKW6_FLAJ1|nr:OsmC family protein [Flavobacterium johnsoniae]ABQ04157.1 OsmC family protein [Flavobacterium johnsoniae UW101]OXG02611.1 osmotically inducible protein OsmC [Flavobacterium johnsoniae UW101]WQG78973.1 OsmC family protein [Flavobacterium johnsoniae UW101]SHK13967.1 Organic hydroperoxide reductase OsmC/OhrA [Flavobacterium johnsoniae]